VPANWTEINPDVDDHVDGFTRLEGQTAELRANAAGSDFPDDPVLGQFFLLTATVPHQLYQYCDINDAGAAWVPAATGRLFADLNADPDVAETRTEPFRILGLCPENVAALHTATATNAGMLERKTGDGELYMADQPVSGGWKGLLSVAPLSYDTVELQLESSFGNDAVNPPTQQSKGVLTGWLFDATNEKRTFAFTVPRNWQGATDAKFKLYQVLNAAQTGGDDIEWSGEIRTLIPGQEKVAKAATALVDAVTDVGAVADGIDDGGGPHVTTLNIDYDDATNPLSAGCLVLVTVWRKTVGGAGKAAGTVVFGALFAYAQKPRHERAV
jgi:hypothetical protein